MSATLLNVLIVLLIVLVAIKIFRFTISKIFEIALLVILFYIGIKIFQGEPPFIDYLKILFSI